MSNDQDTQAAHIARIQEMRMKLAMAEAQYLKDWATPMPPQVLMPQTAFERFLKAYWRDLPSCAYAIGEHRRNVYRWYNGENIPPLSVWRTMSGPAPWPLIRA